ncbi:arsenate reductase family protein [Moheibacter lacus]|uniref:Arsenate reductase n=1 Tax=Moheibacter lacus TaxID=2745851 RepID=A0A838ZP06_9FLAO|nr:ArsC/Spx/MgsR family protein [Moheibacter lacus]MBA5629057.1 arsenate reductase [Moheibacter lacus]
MKKIYYLQTCDTCRRIMKELDFSGFEKQEIKTEPITAKQLDEMKKLSGSYEALFSRRAKKYKEMGLKDENLSEKDFQHYILNDYTFLKRPVIIDGNQIFIGNEKKNLAALALHLEKN